MRLLGTHHDRTQAQRFINFLDLQGISSKLDVGGGESEVQIWIIQEDDLPEAQSKWEEFLQSPDDEKYQGAEKLEKGLRAIKERGKKSSRVQKAQRLPWQNAEQQDFPVTIILIVVSVAVTFLTHFGERREGLFEHILITNSLQLEEIKDREGQLKGIAISGRLPEVERGEVWRLITPIFLHWSPLHLVMNMYWTFLFGSFLERRKGSLFLLIRVLAIGVVSNWLQFYFQGPYFGGMSGVGYGLFGYLWIKGVLAPEEGLGIEQNTIFLFLVWFVICVTGGTQIANYAHGGGLLMGMLFASMPWMFKRR